MRWQDDDFFAWLHKLHSAISLNLNEWGSSNFLPQLCSHTENVYCSSGAGVASLGVASVGLRDAGAAFDRKVLDVMILMGVSLGKFSICVGYRKAHVICRDECLSKMNTACPVQMVRLVRWCDDFSLSGRRSLCSTFRDELGKHLLVKTTAVLPE